MYIGDVDDSGSLHLLVELIQNSVDEVLLGKCKHIQVSLHADGYVDVAAAAAAAVSFYVAGCLPVSLSPFVFCLSPLFVISSVSLSCCFFVISLSLSLSLSLPLPLSPSLSPLLLCVSPSPLSLSLSLSVSLSVCLLYVSYLMSLSLSLSLLSFLLFAFSSVSVVDDGRGIPCDPLPLTASLQKSRVSPFDQQSPSSVSPSPSLSLSPLVSPPVSALEVVLTRLHSGGKFSVSPPSATTAVSPAVSPSAAAAAAAAGSVSSPYSCSGGLHGVGLPVLNALSSRLRAEVNPKP